MDSSITDTYVASSTPDFTAYNPTTFETTGGSASAYKTIADVNLKSFSPGDNVLFRKSQTWREQLTVPSSGSAGSPITFGAYGSGNLPLISGANVIAGPWTQDVVTAADTETYESGSISAYWDTVTGASDTTIFKNGSKSWRYAPSSSDLTTINWGGTNTNYAEMITWWRLDSTSTAVGWDQTETIAFEGNSWYGGDGVIVWIDKSGDGSVYELSLGRGGGPGAIRYTITPDTWYQLRFVVTANNGAGNAHAELYVNGTQRSSLTGLTLADAINFSLKMGAFLYQPTHFKVNFDDTNVYTSDSTVLPNRWYSTVTTQPKVAILSRVLGTLAGSATAVDTVGEWFWSANTLYVYSVANPGATAIEAGARANVILWNSKNYIRLENLQIEGANSTISDGAINVQRGSMGWQIDGVTAQFNRSGGIFFDSEGGTVANVTALYNGDTGMDFDSADGMTGTDIVVHHNLGTCGIYLGAITPSAVGNTFTRITSYNNTNQGFCLGGSDNTIIQDSVIYNNGNIGMWVGAYAQDDVDGLTFRRNRVYGNKYGVMVQGTTTENVALTHNLIYGNTEEGIHFKLASPSNIAYNNVLYANGKGLRIDDASTIANVRNNIFLDNTVEIYVDADVNQALTVDYNDYYHTAGGTPFFWKGTTYNFANWKTNSSQDVYSLNSDPLFTNSAGNDFTLQSTSPAINAGFNLSSTYQLALDPASFWPGSVLTLNQNNYGYGWEMGAYVFIPITVSGSSILLVSENTLALCSDNNDNDRNGLTDLADPNCAPFALKLNATTTTSISTATTTVITTATTTATTTTSTTPPLTSQELLASLIAQLKLLLQQAQNKGVALPTGAENFLSPSALASAFKRDLQIWSRGEDVRQLQIFLNSKGFLVAQTGSGSPGKETSLFGRATMSALAKYQKGVGISPASGYFGAKTRAYMKSYQ